MQSFLAGCRYLLVVPVVGCVLLTAGVVAMGIIRVFSKAIEIVGNGDFSAKTAKKMSLSVIEIIDLFLIGTVSYITAIGLYKLFISEDGVRLPTRMRINNLKDLEDKIIGVIVAALAVAFLGQAAGTDEATQLLNYGGGIALVIIALGFFVMQPGGKKKEAGEAEK